MQIVQNSILYYSRSVVKSPAWSDLRPKSSWTDKISSQTGPDCCDLNLQVGPMQAKPDRTAGLINKITLWKKFFFYSFRFRSSIFIPFRSNFSLLMPFLSFPLGFGWLLQEDGYTGMLFYFSYFRFNLLY